MALAIFDLDNTLIAGDSDHSWGEFLVERNLVDAIEFKEANDRFYQEYEAGTLDIFAYQAFALAPIVGRPQSELTQLHNEFMRAKIAPLMLEKAKTLINGHKKAGDTMLVITATNRFVAGPIAQQLGFEHILATEPEIIDGLYTGNIVDVPCFQEGKVTRLNNWLKDRGETFESRYFYSDSQNDVPLLEQVNHPVAVDPSPKLKHIAESRNWPVISLR